MKFKRLNPNEVKPTGWFLTQLNVEAQGLFGNMDNACDNIKNSLWLGGTADKNADVFPVWLKGYILLSYAINNQNMQEKAENYIKKSIETLDTLKSNVYATFLMLDTFETFHSITNDQTIEMVIIKTVKSIDEISDKEAMTGNAHARYAIISAVIDYISRYQDEPFLFELKNKLMCQCFDWNKFDMQNSKSEIWADGYNNAISLRTLSAEAQEKFENEYVLVNGGIAADNILTNKNSQTGSELATLCQYIFSLEKLILKTGRCTYADKIERSVFNSFFASINPAMTAYKRIDQLNCINCIQSENFPFSTIGTKATTFGSFANSKGIEFGTVLPEFLHGSVLRSDKGLAIINYIPTHTETIINDKKIVLDVITDYPFKENIKIKVYCDSPTEFTLSLRIPEWADEARLGVGKEPIYPRKNAFYDFSGIWDEVTEINLTLRSEFKLQRQPSDLFSIVKGTLLFAMPLYEEKNSIKKESSSPYSEYELTTASTWSYGIYVENRDNFNKETTFEEKKIGKLPFSSLTPPIELYIYGKKIQWAVEKNSPALKTFAVASGDKKDMLKFIPYGSTNLHMAVLPTVK